jgi:hypothetical protein
MLLRICLIVALVAVLGGLGLSFKVSSRIDQITQEKNEALEAKAKADSEAADAKKKAKAAEAATKAAKDELELAKTNLFTITAKANEQEKLARDLAGRLDQMTKSFNDADTELAQWKALRPITPDKIRDLQAELKKVIEDREIFAKEKTILTRTVGVLEETLAKYEGKKQIVKLPPLKGKVQAVDPKYGFLVLNLGSDQGLLKNGMLVVTRQGKLLSKVKVASLENNRSIANIIPGWSQGEIMEGDEVLTSYEALAQP